MAERVTYVLTLTDAAADDAPPEQRLRLLLKVALRVYGLRCVRVEQPQPQESPPGSEGSPDDTRGEA